jgi:UDP-N-acetylmuramoyl-tripeptide--D-alanyl-D-alanine ligase
MPTFPPAQLAQWLNTPWNKTPTSPCTGISTDTRTLQPGNLYIALKGEQFDGHKFIEQAFQKGALGAVVENDSAPTSSLPILSVPNTLTALQQLAAAYRKTWNTPVIGLSGSVGKTMTKEMLAAIFSEAGKTHATPGNLNNHIGLPLSILSAPPDLQYSVFEIGINHPGEMHPLAQILQPNLAFLTHLAAAHIEYFSSIKEIAQEKGQLLAAVPASGTVFLDPDDPWFSTLRPLIQAKIRTLGFNKKADYSAEIKNSTLCVNGHSYPMPLPGKHVMHNALRAIATALELGLTPSLIAQGLLQTKLPPMRWERSEINGIQFINDAYNANPLSMRANLQTFAEIPTKGKKWAVLGGMRELGKTTHQEHLELLRFARSLSLDGLLTVGELFPDTSTSTPAEAAKQLKKQLRPGDLVLLKASRGEHLENLLKHFKEL